ncbi:hypothetical protein VOLCADRAFT_107736 [Volvox carteri f. nagariensis]|uniref:WD repeat-containing protein 75 second beta-propeller domain-containing protein n=1 Tax=Volvox carteri f. nagariensis TaxID=3068 RepID=D8UFY8_VOLCA|nr:uncharacterized protein VOLCADRAFT_107736 [Volvox carteri f. nagariensis]EFJ41335.1 hypothetical protein VOLCADRAFT_107736 [Volvox carteri f. nagariensis]|eukprot:XP_002957565.1 hypothetical protein VOLCADRAFT_107736 [Volvox carteri f. nagariensis]
MVGGGILSRRPGTLSGDGKLLLCPCGRLVNIYSAVTGERVGVLVGHTDEVTGVVLDPENDDQAYSCSLDCTVRLWDYRSGEELRRLVVRESVKYMVIQKELGVAYFSVQLREGGGRVMLYNIRTGKFSGNALKTRSAGPLVLSPAGTLAATIDRHSLFVWRTGTDVHQPLNLHHTKPYTCLALSPDDSLIAAGDVSGRILLWRSFEHSVPAALRDGEHSGKAHPAVQPPLTTLHWHAHPVGALAFSPDGTYLLSGGQEGVLVLWQLDSNRRTFLPRLGGPIVGLHPSPADPAKHVVRQADNIVRVVNAATMKVEMSVVGLQPPPASLSPPPAGAGGAAAAVVASGSPAAAAMLGPGGGGSGGGGVLLLSCENAQLQFYDLSRDRHIRLLQVAPRNAVSLTEPTAGAAVAARGTGPPVPVESPLPPYVSLLALSFDGSVLATVDVRPDAGPYGSTEACLKFWDTGSGSGSRSESSPFSLNTRVDEPHRDVVTSLSYHPRRHMAVTTGGLGTDSEFKVWVQERRRPESSGGGGSRRRRRRGPSVAETSWRCRSTGGYKGLPLAAATFSTDGSVLAVAAGARVTLWDAESNALAAVLPAADTTAAGEPSAAPPLTQLVFVPGTPLLAAASPSCLAVYNLLTAAVHWCLPLNAISISADAAYGLLAVAIPVAPAAQQQAAAAAAAAAAPTTRGAAAPGAADATAIAAVPAAASTATAGKGAARHQPPRPPPPSCHVVVFDPRDATPRYHCHVAGAAHVHIAHLQGPGGTVAAAGGFEAVQGCNPLFILRDNRQYSLAALPASKALHLDAVGLQGRAATPLERGQQLSAFEAVFGRTTGRQEAGGPGGAAPMDVDMAAVAAGAGSGSGGRPRWAQLFDAPSHVLPPPTALASAFLTLLTTADP